MNKVVVASIPSSKHFGGIVENFKYTIKPSSGVESFSDSIIRKLNLKNKF